MTKLTLQLKSAAYRKNQMLRLKKRKHIKNTPYHSYTNFSGNYGHSLTKEEIEQDLQYAQSVCRQKFW